MRLVHRLFSLIHETGMELAKRENWASSPDVEQLLGHMLAMPKADHAEAVATLLNGDELRTVHAVSLLRASN